MEKHTRETELYSNTTVFEVTPAIHTRNRKVYLKNAKYVMNVAIVDGGYCELERWRCIG